MPACGDRRAFAAFLAPLRKKSWFVYAKPPFAGPEAVLAYLSRYTHRVAISNSRLIALDEAGVTFRYKDYRRNGRERYRTMTLEAGEFIRRFLLHVLPKGFHRIRHYGLLASAGRKANIAHARELLAVPQPKVECRGTGDADAAAPTDWRPPCPCCGGRMVIIETFERGATPALRHRRHREQDPRRHDAPRPSTRIIPPKNLAVADRPVSRAAPADTYRISSPRRIAGAAQPRRTMRGTGEPRSPSTRSLPAPAAHCGRAAQQTPKSP